MASKKNKKSKGVTMSLQEFTSTIDGGAGSAPVGAGQNVLYADKKPTMSNWADEVEEDGSFFDRERIILPSAPRAVRGPAYDDNEIPRNPPFTAHLGNLPYDISDEEIYKFFRDLEVVDLKLPRDPMTQRLKGFGYVDFGTREDLIQALIKNESQLRGRQIRINLGTGQQDKWQRGGGMGEMRGDGERRRRPPAEDDDVDDWRSVMKPQGFEAMGEPEFRRGPPSTGGGPGDYGSMPRSYNRDRGYGGPPRGGRGPPPPQEELDFSRSQMMQGPPPGPPPQHYNTYGGRGSGPRGGGYQYNQGRDRDYYDNRDRYGGGDRDRGEQNFYRGGGERPPMMPSGPQGHSRHHSESSDAETGGTWRREQRPPREHTLSQSSHTSSQHNYGPSSSNYPSSHHQRSESPPMRRPMSPDYSRSRERDDNEEDEDNIPTPEPPQPQPPKERKRLVLKPRTVETPIGEPEVGASSIFGGAKPVDTQKKEREIEEKLEKLKVDTDAPKEGEEQSVDEEGGAAGGGPGSRPSGGGPPQRQQSRTDRDRGERPKQFRLLTRNNSGSGSNAGKDSYIDVDVPFDSVKGGGGGPSSGPSRSRHPPPPMQAPPPFHQHQPAFGVGRMGMMRRSDDDKERGMGGDRERGYRGGRGGGPGGPGMRRGDLDRGGRGGGEFRRGPGRDHDGGPRGGGRSFDRDHHGGRGGSRGGGYGSREDFGRGGDRGEDFRRGPPHHGHHNNNSSIGSQSEERDRDSHSEPEDDRDMMRGGEKGGDFSDDSGDFTRVEHRRGRKSYNNRMSNNPNNNTRQQPPAPPPQRSAYYNRSD